jgi:hypothetical protein
MISGQQNMWVLKPNDCNRGRGVNLFSTLDQLKKLLFEYTQGVEVQPTARGDEDAETDDEPRVKKPLSIIKSDVFVIQKYTEQPQPMKLFIP